MALRADDVDLGRDRALVVRYQAGHHDAFDDLYRRYFERLQRFCERRVGDPHEAEELAQEAFVRALRAMPGFAGERRFYPWMTVIASRLCVDAHRRRQRSTPVADVELGSVELDVDDLFAEVDRTHLARALEQLAPRHREVLALREYHAWSYQRIADHYDVTLGTVEALLHRARRALRREFEKITAGDGAGVLAGVPGLAWVLRRAGSLRARAIAQLGDLATPLSAAVASVAIAAGSVAIIDGAGATAPTNAHRAVVASVVSVTDGRLASATTVAAGQPVPPSFVLSSGDSASTSAPARTTRRPVARVDAVSPDEARDRTVDAPVREEVTGLGGVAVDPAGVVADAIDRFAPILRRNP